METRILLPVKHLEILFKSGDIKKKKKASKEKPTSSSGCGVDSDLSEDYSEDDSELDFPRPSSSSDLEEDDDDDEEWKGKAKKGIWNPSYNLRRKPCDNKNLEGQIKILGAVRVKIEAGEDEKKGGILVKEEEDDTGIIVRANADSGHSQAISRGDGTTGRGKVGSFFNMRICAKKAIEKGTVLSANEGEVCILHLKDVPAISKDDVRFMFGCFDRLITDEEGKDEPEEDSSEEGEGDVDDTKARRKSYRRKSEIHLCNWIRFLKQAPEGKANVKATFQDHQPVFLFLTKVECGQDILVHFQGPKEERDTHGQRAPQQQQAPLDLSKATTPEPPKSTPVTIFPFSINNVLQPGKMFQPYKENNNHPNKHNTIIHPGSTRIMSHVHYNPRSHPPSSIQGNTNPGISNPGGGGPMLGGGHGGGHGGGGGGGSLQGGGMMLRPILRTRGRERSLLPCEVCGKAFDRPSLLKRHMRTHTGEKPHICDVCSKGFSTSSSLNTHRRIHSGEKPHQCPICGKRFTASSNLYYHRMTHNKEKPHKCLLCGKSFPTPGDLKSHQYVHSGSWPYNCPVCHRGFSKQTNLRNHLLLHSGDKPHNCQICGKKFALACNLRAHLRTHEEEPVSSCLSCKRTFLTSLNMLEKGQCRACIIHQQSQGKSSLFTLHSPGESKIGETRGSSNSSATTTPTNNPGNLNSLSALSKYVGEPPNLSFPLEDTLTPAAFLSNPSAYLTPEHLLRPNPFLEQFLQWNWRFAKETAGNLGLMQQKLLESQMLAAQLMSVSSNGGLGAGSDILKFRL